MNAPANRPPVGTNRPGAPTAEPPKPFDLRSKIQRGGVKSPPRIFLYGVEKIGKSTCGLAFKNPLYLVSEPLVGVQFEGVQVFQPETWEEMMQALDALYAEPGDFDALVYDNVDQFEALCHSFMLRRDSTRDNVLRSIEDYGYGKGFKLAAEEFRRLLMRLDRLRSKGLAILALAHSSVRTFKNPTGEDYDRHEPKPAAAVSGLFKEWADAVLFAEFETFTQKGKGERKAKAYGGETRIVHTTKSAGWDAGNRYGLPDVMGMDMPEILAAIQGSNGAGSSDADMLAEIESLSSTFPDNVRQAVAADVEKSRTDAAALARVLNKVRAAATKYNTTTEESEN